MAFKKTAAGFVLLMIIFAPAARAQTRDLVNDNPYYQEAKDYKAKHSGYFKKDSKYFKDGSAYFPGKSNYFKKHSPYVTNNDPNFIERFFNGAKSLFS